MALVAQSTMASPSTRSQPHASALPVPVSITLYNLMSPLDENNTRNNVAEFGARSVWFRPEHGSHLLVPVCLKVVVDGDDEGERILYKSIPSHDSVHPCWDLLDERIQELAAVSAVQESNSQEQVEDSVYEELSVYESMRAVIAISNESLQGADAKTRNNGLTVLADAPLHPKRLRKLPPQDVSSAAGPPLKALPPNAVIIRYSDGSARVLSSLYDTLLRQQIISEDNVDLLDVSAVSSDSVGKPRFDDNVFDALDAAASTPQRTSPSALLMAENHIDVKASDLPDELLQPSLGQQAKHKVVTPPKVERISSLLDSDDETLLLPSEADATKSSLSQEIAELEELLKREESELEHDYEALKEAKGEVMALMDEVKLIEQETKDIVDETKSEKNRQAQIEFQLEAHRRIILQDLRTIYPIDCKVEKTSRRYYIRGLELPPETNYTSHNEEELSAALGYTCHVVSMISKYLAVPLRYRLVCNSSSSAVQEDGHTIFPLFQARMVEKTQLDRGVLLLNRNVDCLLMARGLQMHTNTHILGKIKRLYDAVIDGV